MLIVLIISLFFSYEIIFVIYYYTILFTLVLEHEAEDHAERPGPGGPAQLLRLLDRQRVWAGQHRPLLHHLPLSTAWGSGDGK